MALDGFRPDDFYCRDFPEPVPCYSKTVPANIERRIFKETSTTGYRLKQAAQGIVAIAANRRSVFANG